MFVFCRCIVKARLENKYSHFDIMIHTCYSSEFLEDYAACPPRWEEHQVEVVGEGSSHDP